ncbi:hypothetical protein EIP86_010015 [Pleurotus ostreatoroseus]|nr:hypothetical protein EIP86_010015 [Pleurotus ostreatoroseus]
MRPTPSLQNHDSASGPNFINQFKTVLGTGVFNADGEMWKFHRNMTRPFFTKERISHFDIFDRHADEALRLLRERLHEGHPVDIQDLMGRFTLDSATEYLFGQNVDSLSAPLPYPPSSPLSCTPEALAAKSHPANRFSEEFVKAQVISLRRAYFSNAWPLWEFWRNKAAVHVRTVDEFIEPLCRAALQRKAQREMEQDVAPGLRVEDADDETLLEHLVNLTDGTTPDEFALSLDLQVIRDETVNIMVAGRDSTTITLTMACYRLAQYPEVFHRLRQEVIETVGTGKPTYDDIRKMKYLRAVINEVLRLYPPVPFNLRYAKKDTVWPSMKPDGQPIFVPKGMPCLFSPYLMQRRKDLWGPDADRFDPDRFLDERLDKYLTPNPFIFIPFNAGPRICLGKEFAYNEASFMLIRLLQQVHGMRLVQHVAPDAVPPPGWADSLGSDGSDEVIFKHHLTIYVQGGVWLEMDMEDPDEGLGADEPVLVSPTVEVAERMEAQTSDQGFQAL